MDDDLDVLLDDVEAKYCAAASKLPTPTLSQVSAPPSSNSLSEAINEICNIPDPDHPDTRQNPAQLRDDASTARTRQCYAVHLGGTDTALGLSTSVTKRACNRLQCFRCDFQVCMFDGFAWSVTTDYLFLRNNVPDFGRLRAQLARKPGSRINPDQFHRTLCTCMLSLPAPDTAVLEKLA